MKIILSVLLLIFCFVGYEAYSITYYDHSPYWGVPMHISPNEGGVKQLAENHEDLEKKIAATEPDVAKLRAQITDMERQQRVLYNQLFHAIVDLEKKSNLLPETINKIGPMANMDLKDFTKTDVALQAAATYEANLPPDSPLRETMSSLRMSLMQTSKVKLDFLEKMAKHEAEDPIVIEPDPVVDTPQTQPDPNYFDPNDPFGNNAPQVPVPPPVHHRGWNISDADGWLLWAGHKIMVDIDVVQGRMAKNVITIVQKYQLLDQYKNQLALEEENPSLRVVGSMQPVTFIFLQKKSKGIVKEGDPLFRCRLGVLWCDQVGTIKGIYDQPQQASHPVSHALVDGFMAEIELTNKSAGAARVLHIYKPTDH